MTSLLHLPTELRRMIWRCILYGDTDTSATLEPTCLDDNGRQHYKTTVLPLLLTHPLITYEVQDLRRSPNSLSVSLPFTTVSAPFAIRHSLVPGGLARIPSSLLCNATELTVDIGKTSSFVDTSFPFLGSSENPTRQAIPSFLQELTSFQYHLPALKTLKLNLWIEDDFSMQTSPLPRQFWDSWSGIEVHVCCYVLHMWMYYPIRLAGLLSEEWKGTGDLEALQRGSVRLVSAGPEGTYNVRRKCVSELTKHGVWQKPL